MGSPCTAVCHFGECETGEFGERSERGKLAEIFLRPCQEPVRRSV